MHVDLDADYGKAPRRDGKKNEVYCVIKCTKAVRMAAITGYLSKQMAFDQSVLEAISKRITSQFEDPIDLLADFLDHLLRQWPSMRYTVQKRNFYNRGDTRTSLDTVVEAFKGVYASMRLCDVSFAGPLHSLEFLSDKPSQSLLMAVQDLDSQSMLMLPMEPSGLPRMSTRLPETSVRNATVVLNGPYSVTSLCPSVIRMVALSSPKTS